MVYLPCDETMVRVVASQGSAPGSTLSGSLVMTAISLLAVLLAHRVWTAKPNDDEFNLQVRYIPRSVLRLVPTLTGSLVSISVALWFELLGIHVGYQPVHFFILLIATLCLALFFVGFIIGISVVAVGKPTRVIPPRMRT
jgi:hypothetical protein